MSASEPPLPPGVRLVGDAGLLVEVAAFRGRAADPFDVITNAGAIVLAHALRREALPGVRDVVPTFRSVAVHFDPLRTDVDALALTLGRLKAAVRDDVEAGVSRTDRSIVEIPVAYGGEHGPDLDDLARLAGCSPADVVARHTSRTYRVFMLGFLPGFPYMAAVDPTIAAPRHRSPRVRVAAGSVGIAGRQTGIYPRESPGGWRIIGRTRLTLFDPVRARPALLSPGDEVRFVPDDGIGASASIPHAVRSDSGTVRLMPDAAGRHATVLQAGLFTTIQDSGRWGHQASGVPVAGPMDPLSHEMANLAAGNPRDAAALEATLAGPELRFDDAAVVAIAGADLAPTLDSAAVPPASAVACRPGSILRFGGRRAGTRTYIAVRGGIAVPPVLGSRATHTSSGLGGQNGRALRTGDRLPIGPDPQAGVKAGLDVSWTPKTDLQGGRGGARLRILPGPQLDLLARDALDALQRQRFVVSSQSNRMGYRLQAATPLARGAPDEMMSDATFPGAVQVPPSGEPILLMADRQTTGGYPQLAVVITADLPLAGQLAPGDWVEFALCTRREAIEALAAQARMRHVGD